MGRHSSESWPIWLADDDGASLREQGRAVHVASSASHSSLQRQSRSTGATSAAHNPKA